MRDHPLLSRHRRGYPILDPARDPFADTVLDYAYNLAASGALLIPDHIEYYDDKRNLVRTLVARHPTPTERRLLARCNRFKPVWCVEDGGMERRRRPSLDGKATHEDEPATLDP